MSGRANEWPTDPAALRLEVKAMRDALVATVLARVPREKLRGLYFKGSASKPWFEPMDYVPELSDLDVHVWLADAADQHLFTHLEAAIDFGVEVEAAFLARIPQPLHWPRPQVSFLNDLVAQPGFARSPVHVLLGEPYPGQAPDAASDAAKLRANADAVERLGESLFDKAGPSLFAGLRQLSYRVSPTVPRLLSALGAPEEVAWGLPRSQLVKRLEEAGHASVARVYRAYYEAAWQGFLGGWRDPRPMREALRLALRVLREARGALAIYHSPSA